MKKEALNILGPKSKTEKVYLIFITILEAKVEVPEVKVEQRSTKYTNDKYTNKNNRNYTQNYTQKYTNYHENPATTDTNTETSSYNQKYYSYNNNYDNNYTSNYSNNYRGRGNYTRGTRGTRGRGRGSNRYNKNYYGNEDLVEEPAKTDLTKEETSEIREEHIVSHHEKYEKESPKKQVKESPEKHLESPKRSQKTTELFTNDLPQNIRSNIKDLIDDSDNLPPSVKINPKYPGINNNPYMQTTSNSNEGSNKIQRNTEHNFQSEKPKKEEFSIHKGEKFDLESDSKRTMFNTQESQQQPNSNKFNQPTKVTTNVPVTNQNTTKTNIIPNKNTNTRFEQPQQQQPMGYPSTNPIEQQQQQQQYPYMGPPMYYYPQQNMNFDPNNQMQQGGYPMMPMYYMPQPQQYTMPPLQDQDELQKNSQKVQSQKIQGTFPQGLNVRLLYLK